MIDTPQSSAVTRKIAANALAKLQAGKSVSKSEQEALEQVEQEQKEKQNPTPRTHTTQVRWTKEQAAREFDINPRTLAKNLTQANQVAGDDGKFSTRQIVGAVFTDYELERTAAMKASREQAEFDLAKARNEVLPVDSAFLACSNVLFAVKRIVEMSALPAEQKDDIYKEIQGFDANKLIEEKKFEET